MSKPRPLPNFTVPAAFQKRWVQHVLFWSIYLMTILVENSSSLREYPYESFLELLATNLVFVPFAYVLTLWIIPKFLYPGKWLAFLALCIGLITTTCAIMYASLLLYIETIISRFPEAEGEIEVEVFDPFGLTILFLFVVLGIKVGKDSWLAHQEKLEQEKLLLTEEVSLLRAQISPHFLLNSLNTIYGLSLSQPEEVPQTVVQLSDLLRFTLYDAHDVTIPLHKELKFVCDYVAMQQIRASEKLHVQSNIPALQNSQLQIAPLLFIVFVENAFKFEGKNEKGNRFIDLNFDLKDSNSLHFSISNSTSAAQAPREQGGVGLSNVKRRLQLLYPNKHDLKLGVQDGVYSVQLTLALNP